MDDEWYPLVSDRKAGASRFYAFDALGTTRALTNQSQLTTHQFTDDAYGNVLTATDPTATPHQYIGKLGYYADAASGLQLLTQRYYDPGVGRFVTEDPVRDRGNWWGYGEADPSGSADPSGLNAIAIPMAGRVFLAGVSGFAMSPLMAGALAAGIVIGVACALIRACRCGLEWLACTSDCWLRFPGADYRLRQISCRQCCDVKHSLCLGLGGSYPQSLLNSVAITSHTNCAEYASEPNPWPGG